MEFKEIQSLVEISYILNGFKKEFEEHGVIGDIAEVGLFGEEVGELLDAIRKDGDKGVECADLVIRVMNFCNRKGIDLEHEILKKNEKNMKRKYLHGKKA